MITMRKIPASMHWVLIGFGVALLVLGVFASQAMAQDAPPQPAYPMGVMMESPHFKLNWSVLAGGGGVMSSSNFVASTTMAQPAIGEMSSTHFNACTGFWCGVGGFIWRIMLPLVGNNF